MSHQGTINWMESVLDNYEELKIIHKNNPGALDKLKKYLKITDKYNLGAISKIIKKDGI